MTITVSIPDRLSDQAAAQGLTVEAYVEELAVRALGGETASTEENRRSAVEGLLAFRRQHRLTLDRDHAVGLRVCLHQDQKR